MGRMRNGDIDVTTTSKELAIVLRLVNDKCFELSKTHRTVKYPSYHASLLIAQSKMRNALAGYLEKERQRNGKGE